MQAEILIEIIILAITAFIALEVHIWTVRHSKNEVERNIIEGMQKYNELVISNVDLQDLALERHKSFVPNHKLTRDDIKKIYTYFIKLNIYNAAYKASKEKVVSSYVYDSIKSTLAKTTYLDREFLKKHVLPRGYTQDFVTVQKLLWPFKKTHQVSFSEELQMLWKQIDDNKL